jgi:hypothetical protein
VNLLSLAARAHVDAWRAGTGLEIHDAVVGQAGARPGRR